MSAATLAVSVSDLSYRYGDRVALDAVSLELAVGGSLALVGPNGSGKSTLLSLLSTRLKPHAASKAKIHVGGHDVVASPDAVRRAIAVVFQQPSVDVKLTAEENLKYEAMLHGLAAGSRRAGIDEALEAAGLSERRRDRVEAFSGGMKRRLEIAKAMMHRPTVLLLDEPDTGLDVRALDEVWRQLEVSRAQHGTALVIATHRMELAERCDAVAVLSEGRCVAQGSPSELRESLPGGAVRVEADADRLPEILEALTSLRTTWTEAAKPRRVRHEIVAYDEQPAQLAAALNERLGEALRRVSYGHSTLHDVFLAYTGRVMGSVSD